MKILSLFDGMACGMIVMLNAGIEVESYDAYEIDKYAIQVSSHNFPNIRHHGDVFKADFTQHEGVDFLVGGSPCTYWSIAQKNGRETEASGMGWELFSQYVRAVKEAKPKFFIYENNKSMSAAIRESIDKAFGFEAVCINSALVSAQNRQRLYWVGMRNKDGTYSKVPVDQPEDKSILLRDILESHVTEQAYELQSVGIGYRGRMEDGKWVKRYESNGEPKANAITTAQTDSMVAEPVRVGDIGSTAQAHRVYSCDGKSVTINAGGGGQGGKTGLYLCPVLSGGENIPVYQVKNGMIAIKGKQYPIKLEDGFYIIRKLTVTECMRLQTVPEWYDFSVISNSQAYKCLGNGWTCDVITHLIKATQTVARRKWLDELLGGCL